MPIKRCTLPNGESGYKAGDTGKCYKSRKKAEEQLAAIKISQQNSKSAQELVKYLEILNECCNANDKPVDT